MLNDIVTPEEYLLIEMRLDATRLFLDELEKEAFERACASPPPTHLRPATAADVVENAVLWYPRANFGTLQTWRIVREVRDPLDPWKAYIADDGCRYGLVDAFVRAEPDAAPRTAPTDLTLRAAIADAISDLQDPRHRHGCTGIPAGVETRWVEDIIKISEIPRRSRLGRDRSWPRRARTLRTRAYLRYTAAWCIMPL